jgi:TP901 family phage tail tape measure protein
MTEFGAASQKSSGLFGLSTAAIATAAVGAAAAITVYSVEAAHKFEEGLNKVKNQAGLTTKQMEELGKEIRNISVTTGVSTSNLMDAAVLAEQAGLRGAKATDLLTASAKAAVITNASVVDTTKAIVAAQTLQITKGMEVADLTGILVKGSQNFVGGLQAEEAMLSGKIGLSLAKYGLDLKAIIPLGAEFAKIGLPTKSIVAFTKSLGLITAPIKDAKGNFTAYAKSLASLGLDQEKLASSMRSGDIVGLFTQLKTAAGGNVSKEGALASAVFGTAGSGAALAILKDYQAYLASTTNLSGAGAGTLKSAWSNVSKQLGPQLDILKQQVADLALSLGTILLPKVLVGVEWANKFITNTKKFFDTHPIVIKAVVEVFKFSLGPFAAILKDLGWIVNKIIPSSNPPAPPRTSASYVRTETVRTKTGIKVYVVH